MRSRQAFGPARLKLYGMSQWKNDQKNWKEKKTIWNVRQNATWHRKQNPRYIPDKMSDKLLEYVWNGCADHLSHVQNCRQLILVFGGIYSLKNWLASHARANFSQVSRKLIYAQASRMLRANPKHVDNGNINKWIYNEKGYTTCLDETRWVTSSVVSLLHCLLGMSALCLQRCSQFNLSTK